MTITALSLWVLFPGLFNNVHVLYSVECLWIMNLERYVKSDSGIFEGTIPEYVQRGRGTQRKLQIMGRQFKIRNVLT
jgi:hypothetical protein